MKTLLPFLLTLNVYAASESLCWDNDCARAGWTETKGTVETDVECLRGSCLNEGWVKGDFTSGTYLLCEAQDCLGKGFFEIKRSNQAILGHSKCTDNDCAHNGYVTYGKLASTVICKDNDCFQNGWYKYQNSVLIEDVTCLMNDCLRSGWRNSR